MPADNILEAGMIRRRDKLGQLPVLAMALTALMGLQDDLHAESGECFSLGGTDYEAAAEQSLVDPYLLYAIALAESSTHAGRGLAAPDPFVLRAPNERFRAEDQSEFEYAFERLYKKHEAHLDVGAAGVNVYWARKAGYIDSKEQLLDRATNLKVAARFLATAMASAPDDRELGVGRYHNWADKKRSRAYGRWVLSIHANLQDLRENC